MQVAASRMIASVGSRNEDERGGVDREHHGDTGRTDQQPAQGRPPVIPNSNTAPAAAAGAAGSRRTTTQVSASTCAEDRRPTAAGRADPDSTGDRSAAAAGCPVVRTP